MKFLIVFAVIAVAAALPHKRFSSSEIDEIVSAINSPSTDPATAAALEQMLLDILGIDNIIVGPALVEGNHPINVDPALVEEYHPIHIGPALVEENIPINTDPALVEDHEDITVGPAIIDQPANAPSNSKGPLVQVIVNVGSSSNVYTPEQPAVVPDNVNIIEGEIIPDNVLVVDNKPELEAENINIGAPLIPDIAANLPEDLH